MLAASALCGAAYAGTTLSVTKDENRVKVDLSLWGDAALPTILSLTECVREDREPLSNVDVRTPRSAGRNLRSSGEP